MTKEELAALTAAFEQSGGKVERIADGVTANPEPAFNSTIKWCNCGCHGDWTEHTMRLGEGKFRDQ